MKNEFRESFHRFPNLLGSVVLVCVLSGCGWNERETHSYEFEPVHFLNTDTLYYRQTKSTNVSTCALWSGCDVISSDFSEARKCFSVRVDRQVACPASIPQLKFPTLPDSIVFDGVKSRVTRSAVKDNRVLGFASMSVLDYTPVHRVRTAIYLFKQGDSNWTRMAEPDSCFHISSLGPEARYFAFQDLCSSKNGLAGDSLQFLGNDPNNPEVGRPVPTASVSDMVLNGVIATDSSKYAGFLLDKNGRIRDGIGIFSADGAEIASITAR